MREIDKEFDIVSVFTGERNGRCSLFFEIHRDYLNRLFYNWNFAKPVPWDFDDSTYVSKENVIVLNLYPITWGPNRKTIRTRIGWVQPLGSRPSARVIIFVGRNLMITRSEANFRSRYARMIRKAFGKGLKSLHRNRLIDGDTYSYAVDRLTHKIGQYLSEPLPLPVPPYLESGLDKSTEYFSYFKTREDAMAFCQAVEKLGLKVSLIPSDESFLVHLEDVNHTRIDRRIEAEVRELAEAHGGEYDGWAAPDMPEDGQY